MVLARVMVMDGSKGMKELFSKKQLPPWKKAVRSDGVLKVTIAAKRSVKTSMAAWGSIRLVVPLSTMALGELYSEQGTPKEVPLKATSKMVVS